MTLTGISWDHPRGHAPLVASSQLYEQLTGVRVEWQKRSLAEFGDQSLAELAQSYDLLIIDHPHVGAASISNCILPLDEFLPASTLEDLSNQSAGPSFSSYRYGARQWAIPVDAAVQSACLRPDLMTSDLIPKSWDDVFELGGMLKKHGRYIAMALCPTDCLCSFLSISAQLGSPVREENELLVDVNIGLRTLELLRKMRDHFHADSLEWNPIQLFDHMSSSDHLAYAPLAFCYSNYSRESFRKNKLIYVSPPGRENTVLGGAGIAVSAKTKHPKESTLFAGWIGSGDIQRTVYLASAGQPANFVAWGSEAANELTNHFFLNLSYTIKNAFVRPRNSGWPSFQTHLGETVHAFLSRDAEPRSVLSELQEAYFLSRKNFKTP